MLGWQAMDDETREREYSPSSCLPDGDYRPFVAEYRRASDSVRAQLQARDDVSTFVVTYDEAASQRIEVVTASAEGAPGPLLAFIHGGYWQELSTSDSLFAAAACVDRGWSFAAIGYTLAPAATLDEIVAECRDAVQTLLRQAETIGFDPARFVLAGSSAGAHLAAMMALDQDPALAEVAGVALVSGVFDVEPLIGTSVNDALGLDLASAERNSPLRIDATGFPRTIVAFGSNETSQFKAQSTAFARHLEAAGTPVTRLEVAGRNHFDVILDLATEGTVLGDAVAQLAE